MPRRSPLPVVFAALLALLLTSSRSLAAPVEEQDDTPGREGDDDALSVTAVPPSVSSGSVAPGERLWTEARRELTSLRSSRYSHRTEVDEARGQFDFDCSGFVLYALRHGAPGAFAALQRATVRRPLAKDFVDFLKRDALPSPWRRLAAVAELRPGDIIAWLKPADVVSRNTGHVMIVDASPQPVPGEPGQYQLEVIDSTASPHGRSDPRRAAGATGLGRAPLVIAVDSAGHPSGYRWTTWDRSPLHFTRIVLGRLE